MNPPVTYKMISTHISAGQQTTPQRRVRDDRNPQLSRRFEDVDPRSLDVEREDAVLHLKSRNGMDGVRTTNSGCGALGETNVADLAFPRVLVLEKCREKESREDNVLDSFLQRAHGNFDGNSRIRPSKTRQFLDTNCKHS